MPNNTPETAARCNGLAMLAEDKAESSGKPQSIREFLRENPMGSRMMYELCEKNGIDLDSPWPPQFPASERSTAPKTERQTATPAPIIAAQLQATAEILQFPLPYGDDTRAVSNAMARCALFAPVKERAFFRDYVVVGEIDGYLIEWKGEQLNQDDHDTLLQLVKMALHKAFGVSVVQSVNVILKSLKRHTHKEQRRQFFEQCDRLMSGTIRITPRGKPSYAGHLLTEIITPQDQKTEPQYRRFFSYQLNPRFACFYGSGAFTLINWEERLKLKGRGSEFAKWLQLVIESHADFIPRKVRTLWEDSGKTTKELKHFREKLKQALDLLKEAGIIEDWSIDPKPETEPYGDLVHVKRTPSPAQLEHLNKKAGKRKPKAQK